MPQKNSLPDPSTLTFVLESEEATEAALRHHYHEILRLLGEDSRA